MKYLTITVPCFNSEKYLRRCLDSLMIGGNDMEIIVVDDGSTDKTGEIAALMCYEASRDLKLKDVKIKTPICEILS